MIEWKEDSFIDMISRNRCHRSVPCPVYLVLKSKMSRLVSKPAFCICENKDADQVLVFQQIFKIYLRFLLLLLTVYERSFLQSFIFKSKALFGSKLRATENKPILRILFKRSLIPIRSSNLTYLAPLGQFLMGAKLIIGIL